MDPTVASIFGTITGAIIGAILTGPVTYIFTKKLFKAQEFSGAASKFKATTLYELTGFYPIEDQHWEKNEWPRISSSARTINTAAAEFRFQVTNKNGFDAAVCKYNEFCRVNAAENIFVLEYKDMNGKSLEDYRKEFKQIVAQLLNFTIKK